MRPTSSIAPWTKRLRPVDSPRIARMSVRSPTMPFFDGSDCMSAWNIPISHAVPSSTEGPSRIASIASAHSIPRPVLCEDARRCDVDARRELVLVRDEDLEAVEAQHGGARVDERALVRREQRAGEVDLQGADLQICNLPSSSLPDLGQPVLASTPRAAAAYRFAPPCAVGTSSRVRLSATSGEASAAIGSAGYYRSAARPRQRTAPCRIL